MCILFIDTKGEVSSFMYIPVPHLFHLLSLHRRAFGVNFQFVGVQSCSASCQLALHVCACSLLSLGCWLLWGGALTAWSFHAHPVRPVWCPLAQEGGPGWCQVRVNPRAPGCPFIRESPSADNFFNMQNIECG